MSEEIKVIKYCIQLCYLFYFINSIFHQNSILGLINKLKLTNKNLLIQKFPTGGNLNYIE